MIAHNIIHFQVRPIYHTPPFEGEVGTSRAKARRCAGGERNANSQRAPTKGRPYNESNTSPIYSYSPLLRGKSAHQGRKPPMCRWGEKMPIPNGRHKGRPYKRKQHQPIYHTPPFEGGSRHIKGKSPPMCRWGEKHQFPTAGK